MRYFNIKHLPTGVVKLVNAETIYHATQKAMVLMNDFDSKNYKQLKTQNYEKSNLFIERTTI